jgi:hypothetical protein
VVDLPKGISEHLSMASECSRDSQPKTSCESVKGNAIGTENNPK